MTIACSTTTPLPHKEHYLERLHDFSVEDPAHGLPGAFVYLCEMCEMCGLCTLQRLEAHTIRQRPLGDSDCLMAKARAKTLSKSEVATSRVRRLFMCSDTLWF